ncbi:hypothetical protein [Adhaeribacter aerolatus]|nr:hypothetical protein [Adhaeribacter aerolatus]
MQTVVQWKNSDDNQEHDGSILPRPANRFYVPIFRKKDTDRTTK